MPLDSGSRLVDQTVGRVRRRVVKPDHGDIRPKNDAEPAPALAAGFVGVFTSSSRTLGAIASQLDPPAAR